MQRAGPASVLGDFNDARAEHFKSKARFFRRDGAYFVETEGADGKTATYRVDYTFGLEPLQQYLTTFPNGRVQALPYAWDTRSQEQGGQRWFHLYPDEAVPPGDALHWTGPLQNWNFMCADCHSTAVRKNYDAAKDSFAASFSEIGIGCESCHGPGAGHVGWANGGRDPNVALKGFASRAVQRPPVDWTPDAKTGSPAGGTSPIVGGELETCGRCHLRRSQFDEAWRPGSPLMDHYRPVFLTPDLFEDDGQMKDEVFNLSSFQQSRMFAKGVLCGDCHDPHSGKLKASGAEVCSQCHAAERFAATAHTGHKQGAGQPQSSQPDCISCHMPARTYMVVDPRHDHGFRIPRPDLSAAIGTPNACNDCHRDKPPAWAAQAVERWHGPTRKGFQTYARAFHAARTQAPDARALLLAAARDGETPPLARATAILFLDGHSGRDGDALINEALADPEPMARIAALRSVARLQPQERWRRAAGLLGDPVRAVRLEAVSTLAEGPPTGASDAERAAFGKAAEDYVAAERYNADRAESRTNLGNFFSRRGDAAAAENEYRAAIALAPVVAPRIALADLYRATGREADAESLLRATVMIDPQAAAPRHALGLALVRQKKYAEALDLLKQAAERDPGQPRYAYVYAIALQSTGRADEAMDVLRRAAEANPSDRSILSALLQNALRAGRLDEALGYAQKLSVLSPDDAGLKRIVEQLSGQGRK